MNKVDVYHLNASQCISDISELVNSGASVPVAVSGSSMMPLLKPGRDIVWLEGCTKSSIHKYSILLFLRSDGTPVLHRVIKIGNGKLIMNGDALDWSEVIAYEQVVACVGAIERNGKKLDSNMFLLKIWNVCWRFTRPFRQKLKRIRKALKRGKSI